MTTQNLLAEIFENHRGKYSDKWSYYLEVYWNAFEPLRLMETDILEIGIQNGGSLEIWSNLFPKARNLIGIDTNAKCADLRFTDPRITVLVEDASHPRAADLVSKITSRLGVVIDDGSHISSDIIKSFLLFFPQLQPGGVYIIEDLHASYWLDWEGGLSHPQSSMQFLKLLADAVNFDHWGIKGRREDLFSLFDATKGLLEDKTLSDIESVLFVDSACVIGKKRESHVGLGPRIGSGSDATVVEEVKDHVGGLSVPPKQDNNPFSSLSDLRLELAERLTRQNQKLEAQNQNLSLHNQELVLQIEIERAAMRAIQRSLSWRLTKPLRYLGGATGRKS